MTPLLDLRRGVALRPLKRPVLLRVDVERRSANQSIPMACVLTGIFVPRATLP
jgi:hypothetical protein